MLVRYEGCYVATTVTIMGDRTGFAWQDPPANNYIDELVDAKLKQVRTLAQRPVHRRRVHPPRVSRPDRPAADFGRRAGFPRRPARHAASSATS